MTARDELREAVARVIELALEAYGVPLETVEGTLDDADEILNLTIPRIERETREADAKVADADAAEWKANGCAAQAMGAFSAGKAIRNQEPSK